MLMYLAPQKEVRQELRHLLIRSIQRIFSAHRVEGFLITKIKLAKLTFSATRQTTERILKGHIDARMVHLLIQIMDFAIALTYV